MHPAQPIAFDHPPFCLRGPDNSAVWRFIVGGRTFGDYDNKGAALAGYQTEQRRAAARAQKAGA